MDCRKIIAVLASVCMLLAPLFGYAAPYPAQAQSANAGEASAGCHAAMAAHDHGHGQGHAQDHARDHAAPTPADDGGVSDCAVVHACCSAFLAVPTAPMAASCRREAGAPAAFVAAPRPPLRAADIFRPPRSNA